MIPQRNTEPVPDPSILTSAFLMLTCVTCAMISVVYDIFIITEMKENLKLSLSLKRTISAAFEIKPQCVVSAAS